jgi:hypothetical protein
MEGLRARVVRAAALMKTRAGRLAREAAPPKGQEALAAANFHNLKTAAAELSAIRQEFSSFRASFEASQQANKAFHAELLSALVSFPSPFVDIPR